MQWSYLLFYVGWGDCRGVGWWEGVRLWLLRVKKDGQISYLVSNYNIETRSWLLSTKGILDGIQWKNEERENTWGNQRLMNTDRFPNPPPLSWFPPRKKEVGLICECGQWILALLTITSLDGTEGFVIVVSDIDNVLMFDREKPWQKWTYDHRSFRFAVTNEKIAIITIAAHASNQLLINVMHFQIDLIRILFPFSRHVR